MGQCLGMCKGVVDNSEGEGGGESHVGMCCTKGRGFIKHRRSENSPSTTHNSSAKFR